MRIVKKAVEIGNGAAVYVPKEYGGREVVVILPEGIDEMKKRVLGRLIEYMPNILGVYLYGSYARDEQIEESDLDILVITKEKDTEIKNALNEIDARVMPIEDVKKAIMNYPLFIVPILKEAKVMLNPLLLEELKNIKFDLKKLRWNFEDIKRIIKIIEGFIGLDEKDISPSHIYSLMMRIRVCYLIECLLKNKEFSNEGVKKLLIGYGLGNRETDKFSCIYRAIRNDEKLIAKIDKTEILNLLRILKDYSFKIENETKKKIKKRN
jgi:predicted nucleotidyltransferase